ncbi:LacI family DNA-binding transcriptional regulator [Pedobacter gandavensis]|uniref:Substrate-binding domain-containing protein n=1 Tax=Pedobacter gandavensis TaxID=2679963 RepID=A0ABR6EUT0_9SPHI|nr:LacI family DNA-binding transcriptional regulator [Pedobacter gandavensis]MBB2149028.1 substrate-binding domain-containing protein [Pedobacter gandavensis]
MNKDKKPQQNTILDIAEALKLSPATISRALNNHPHVKEKTKNDVLKMAAQLGYRRNQMASGLRSNKTHTVGLIVPRISMFFHAEVITTIQNSLHKHGYNLIICQSNDLLSMEEELADILYASRVDALIVACTLQTTDFSHFDKLVSSGIPVIFYDRVPLDAYPATFIKGDDFRGGYLATTHLIETGSQRIAHISGKLSSNLYQDRSAGFRKAMEQHQLPIHAEWVFHQELTHENAKEAMAKMFSGTVVPDALFSANDVTAIAALEFAKENGIQVPRDLKIIGYSNDPRTSITTPALSTIEQYPAKVGQKIVEVLIEQLKSGEKGSGLEQRPYVIPVDLIRRMSS